MKSKNRMKKICIVLIICVVITNSVNFQVGALKDTEAIKVAKEIAMREKESIQDKKDAIKINFDEDDRAQVDEDKQYLKSLYRELEQKKTNSK